MERKSTSHNVKIEAIFEPIKELMTIDKKTKAVDGIPTAERIKAASLA